MIRRAIHRLLRTPGVTVFCVVAIAIGIAASTVVYSTIRGLLHPPGADRWARVANIYNAPLDSGKYRVFFTEDDVEHLRGAQRSFEQIAAWARVRADLAVDRIARDTFCEAVSPEYFQALGVQPAIGRVLLPSDDRPDAAPVAVISHALWRTRFNSDPAILARSLALNGRHFDIVGVAPEWFKGVDIPSLIPTQAWIPLHGRKAVWPPVATERAAHLLVKGKLRQGVTMEAAAAEVRAIGRTLDARVGRTGDADDSRLWHLVPALDIRIHESVHQIAGELAASALLATLVVLMVVSTNLANIQLARMATRRQELAVKLALGAGRGRLALEELTEVLMVAVAGLGLGVALAHTLGTVVLPRLFASANYGIVPAPVLGLPLAMAFAAMVVVLGVAALAPALQVTSVAPRTILAQEDATTSAPRWRGRRALIVVQVTVAVILVNIAMLATTQMLPQARAETERVIAMAGLRRTADRSAPRPFTSDTLAQVRQQAADVQGLGPLALASEVPSGERGADLQIATVETAAAALAQLVETSGPIFEVLGLRIVRGRALEAFDGRDTEPVIVLDEAAAFRLFGSLDVVGRAVITRPPDRDLAGPGERRTIVGVVSPAGPPGERRLPVAYVPLDQTNRNSVLLLAASDIDPRVASERLQQLAIRALPDVTVSPGGLGAFGSPMDVKFEVIGGLTATLGLTSMIVAMGGLFGLLTPGRRPPPGDGCAHGARRDATCARHDGAVPGITSGRAWCRPRPRGRDASSTRRSAAVAAQLSLQLVGVAHAACGVLPDRLGRRLPARSSRRRS